MDDVTLVADSRAHLRGLAVELWEWCWRSRLGPYPEHPKTFVAVLGPGTARQAAVDGVFLQFEMSALRAARRANGHDANGQEVDDATIIATPIDEYIRVLEVKFCRSGRWSKFVLLASLACAGGTRPCRGRVWGGRSAWSRETEAPCGALRRVLAVGP